MGSLKDPFFLLFINELPDVTKTKEDEESEKVSDANDATDEPEIVVYADDSTTIVADSEPEILLQKAQRQGELLPNWFADNDLVVSGEKTKLMIIATSSKRRNITERGIGEFEINVCNETVGEAESEKVLGLIVNNKATWHHHLHGNEDNSGLLKQLSQRVGMLKRLRKYLNERQFKMILTGMFTSKLLYGITTWGGIWGLSSMDEHTRNKMAITKEDMRKLQVIQNKALRLLKWMPRETPVSTLLSANKELSVHQLVAYHTGVQMYKVSTTRQPTYHYARLFENQEPNINTRTNDGKRVEFKLSLARTSFFYQSSRIWSELPYPIKTARSLETFKRAMKIWVKTNIMIKP